MSTKQAQAPRALITGASAGLGAVFARRLAADGYDLVLVARGADRLEELAAELRASSGVEVRVLPADLSDPAQTEAVAAVCADERIDVLVNNAGFGLRSSFLESDPADLAASEAVLLGAVTRLCRAAVPGMVARGRGGVLNVSSMAALTMFGPYSAAKSAVLHLTEALAAELEGTPVTATAVLPGFVRTEFHDRMGVRVDRSNGWVWLEPEAVVDAALRDGRAGRIVSVAGPLYRVGYLAAQVLPRPVLRAASRGFSFRRRR